MGNVVRIWPTWVQTLGAMQDAMQRSPELQVQAMCGKCNTAFRVDVELLIAKFGRNSSLINKHGKCRRVDCSGRCVFQFSASGSTPFQTMTE